MLIQIAGSGCSKCRALEENAREACVLLNLNAVIEHLSDPKEYSPLGVMITPALIIDGKVLLSGQVSSAEEIKDIITAFQKE